MRTHTFGPAALLTFLVIGTLPAVHSRGLRAQEPDAKPLELRVRPKAAQSPATIRVTALIERHPDNRKITIEAESGAFFRSSSSSLDGADAPKSYTRVFASLPAGTYTVTATVERNDGTKLVEVATVKVFGPP